jgi:CheY-like chemotaxis protein
VERAIAVKPDMILMNSLMPEMDGWEATRLLWANPETRVMRKDEPDSTRAFRSGQQLSSSSSQRIILGNIVLELLLR